MPLFMKFFFKKRSPNAQATLEYSFILALVAAGIIVMGPYVIRSWNANLKSAEDSVMDSFHDPLLENPDPGVTLPGGCDCCDLDAGACPSLCGGNYGAIKCEDYELAMIRHCTPDDSCGEDQGLDMIKCIIAPDGMSDCCTLWEDTGLCGDAAAGLPSPIPPNGCENDHMAQKRHCGRTLDEYQCDLNLNPNCPPECKGQILSPSDSYQFCKDVMKGVGPLRHNVDPDDEVIPCPMPPCGDINYTYQGYDDTLPRLGCTSANCEILCCPGWCAEN